MERLTVVPPRVTGRKDRVTHYVQLFDTSQSLAECVTSFMVDGYNQGDNLLIVAKANHRNDIFAAMSTRGCFRDGQQGPQRLVALDAGDVLGRISRAGHIDEQRFDTEVGELVARLASRPLRVYGEIVELLAADGEFEQAIRLEELWNGLGERFTFQLMCGYSSAHFASSGARSALRDICRVHTHATATVDDTLGSYLLTTA